jgi:hypothetical protein
VLRRRGLGSPPAASGIARPDRLCGPPGARYKPASRDVASGCEHVYALSCLFLLAVVRAQQLIRTGNNTNCSIRQTRAWGPGLSAPEPGLPRAALCRRLSASAGVGSGKFPGWGIIIGYCPAGRPPPVAQLRSITPAGLSGRERSRAAPATPPPRPGLPLRGSPGRAGAKPWRWGLLATLRWP